MSPSPLSPRLLKGAIAAVDLDKSRQTTIAFQYNPEWLTRTLKPRQEVERREGGQRAAALRFSSAPEELGEILQDVHPSGAAKTLAGADRS